jgi:hypothetical protein
MVEMASEQETASLKPVLMVAAMLVAALCGAVITVHPVQPSRQPHKAPPTEVVVVQGPRASTQRHQSLTGHRHPAVSAAPQGDWV